MYIIQIHESDEDGNATRPPVFSQTVESIDIKAVFDAVNRKPRAKRSDAGKQKAQKNHENP